MRVYVDCTWEYQGKYLENCYFEKYHGKTY